MADFIKILRSGSKGNCCVMSLSGNTFIIDIGISRKVLLQELEELNLDLDDSHIFITHHHGDHTKGLEQVIKHNCADFYGSSEIACRYNKINVIDDCVDIKGVSVEVVKLSHDAKETLGYIFKTKDYKIVLISDTGYISDTNLKMIYNPDVLLLESNHDVDMLMSGKYSWHLKNRVISDYGHLSNLQFQNYCKHIVGDNTEYLVALHLSEENNCPEIVKDVLMNIDVCNCLVARQDCGCHKIELDWK